MAPETSRLKRNTLTASVLFLSLSAVLVTYRNNRLFNDSRSDDHSPSRRSMLRAEGTGDSSSVRRSLLHFGPPLESFQDPTTVEMKTKFDSSPESSGEMSEEAPEPQEGSEQISSMVEAFEKNLEMNEESEAVDQMQQQAQNEDLIPQQPEGQEPMMQELLASGEMPQQPESTGDVQQISTESGEMTNIEDQDETTTFTAPLNLPPITAEPEPMGEMSQQPENADEMSQEYPADVTSQQSENMGEMQILPQEYPDVEPAGEMSQEYPAGAIPQQPEYNGEMQQMSQQPEYTDEMQQMPQQPEYTAEVQQITGQPEYTGGLSRTLFYCGRPWKFQHHSREGRLICGKVFPEYLQTIQHPAVLLTPETMSLAAPTDILTVASHQACEVQPQDFPGKVLYVNGEAYDLHPNDLKNVNGKFTYDYLPPYDNVFTLGPHEDSPRSIRMTYLQMRFSFLPSRYYELIFDHSKKVKNTKKHFAMYASSHYVAYRERAAYEISQIGVVHAGGKCQGNVELSNWDFDGPPQCEPLPIDHPNYGRIIPINDKKYDFTSAKNEDLYHDYRFSIVMENLNVGGYITEKILLAFLSGTVPIWYGTPDIFDIFNSKAFIYFNVENPAPALEKIALLEANPEEYDAMLAEPILADGEATIEKYFSIEDGIGGGRLKNRIRRMVLF